PPQPRAQRGRSARRAKERPSRHSRRARTRRSRHYDQRRRSRHPERDRAPPLPVVRNERQEGGNRPRASDREENRRRARWHRTRALQPQRCDLRDPHPAGQSEEVKFMYARGILGLLVVSAVALDASASLPPWTDPNDVPLPPNVHSITPKRDELSIFAEPGRSPMRRGTVPKGSRLPFFGSRRGPSCVGRWLLLGPPPGGLLGAARL